MGYEGTCACTFGGKTSEGNAHLETDFIQFRSADFRFKVLFKDLAEVQVEGSRLLLRWTGELARLELGEKAATRWADKILNPPGRLQKLGIKLGVTVCLEGRLEAEFTREVKAHRAQNLPEADLIFLAAPDQAALANIASVAKRLSPKAALWIVFPKGRTEIREMDVLTTGRAAGLKDIKVVRFSETETALKFVHPKQT